MKKESLDDKVYDFIGRLALGLFGQNITIGNAALEGILNDRGVFLAPYGIPMEQCVMAAYLWWSEKERASNQKPVISNAIAETFMERSVVYKNLLEENWCFE